MATTRACRAARLLVVALCLAPAARAQTLPSDVLPDHYALTLRVDPSRETFSGDETILVNVAKTTGRITLNEAGIRFDEVTIASEWSSQPATVTTDDDRETATLSVRRPLLPGAVRIHILYTGQINTDLRGLYTGRAGERRYLATQFEATDARRAFPSFDQPDMKASFSLTVIAPAGDVAISNGRVLSDTPGPDANQHTITFSTTRKMSTYLVALAVGDFTCLDASVPYPTDAQAAPPTHTIGRPDAPVPLRVCAIRGREGLARFALDAAQAAFRYYAGYFTTRYPFEKLDLVAIPDFEGGMENVAAIFFAEPDFLVNEHTASVENLKNVAQTISHEIAHQWLGDLVTMQWWDDLWMKEGLATWIETKPLAAWKPEWHVELDEVAAAEEAMALDALSATHPIRRHLQTPQEIAEAYDAIVYQKAGSVMRMVEAFIGPDNFRAVINDYLRRFAYGTATAADFRQVVADHAVQPVDATIRTFLEQPGVPVVSVSTSCLTPATSSLALTQQRFSVSRSPSPSPAWAIPVTVRSLESDAGTGRVSAARVLTERDQTFDLGGCTPLVFGNADAVGYFRTRYPTETLARVTPDVMARLTPAERLRLIDDQWALAAVGTVDIGNVLSLLAAGVSDRHPQIVSRAASIMASIGDNLTDDNSRDPFRAWVRGVVAPALTATAMLTPGDLETDRRAREATLVVALGTTGADPDVRAKARTAVLASSSGESPDAPLADAYAKIAAASADEAVFNHLMGSMRDAATHDQGRRARDALVALSDPQWLTKALDQAASALPGQDLASMIGDVLENPAGRNAAWSFVKTRWDAISKKVGTTGEAELVAATGTACDAGTRDEVRAFFGGKGLAVSGVLAQSIERIQACIAFTSAQQGNLRRWLADRIPTR